MADTNYKLTYLTIRGLGEGIRYIFAYAGVEYEDIRISQEDWPNYKACFEFKKVPVLEVDGLEINQSAAIARFLGKKFGLVHEDPVIDALLEALIDNFRDILARIKGAFAPKDPEGKKEFFDILEGFMEVYETKVSEGFFYSSKPTWVDLYFTANAETMENYIGPILKPYPNLTALTERVKGLKNIQNWIQTRPADVWKVPENK